MCGIKYKDCECCLECKNIIDDLLLCKCLYCNKNYEKNYNNLIDLLMHVNFLTSMSISLFCFCKKAFTHMNTRMIQKNSIKNHC